LNSGSRVMKCQDWLPILNSDSKRFKNLGSYNAMPRGSGYSNKNRKSKWYWHKGPKTPISTELQQQKRRKEVRNYKISISTVKKSTSNNAYKQLPMTMTLTTPTSTISTSNNSYDGYLQATTSKRKISTPKNTPYIYKKVD
ncbi:24673_t:CDS:2, partial [Dentiscutata erythropus]